MTYGLKSQLNPLWRSAVQIDIYVGPVVGRPGRTSVNSVTRRGESIWDC